MRALRSRTGFLLAVGVLAAALPVSLAVAASFGTNALPVDQVYTIIRWELGHLLLGQTIPAQWAPGTAVHDVVWLIRLPRLVLAAAVGVCLSLCGVAMQAVVQNPLADPYILGISSGASLGATLAVLLGVGAALGQNAVGVMAFLGALASILLVYVLARDGDGITPIRLILVGVAVSALFSAGTNYVVYTAPDDAAVRAASFWMLGGLGSAAWARYQANSTPLTAQVSG